MLKGLRPHTKTGSKLNDLPKLSLAMMKCGGISQSPQHMKTILKTQTSPTTVKFLETFPSLFFSALQSTILLLHYAVIHYPSRVTLLPFYQH